MSQYCRITGKSRGLPKPNYFPLLPPISAADAKKLCRITGKSQGLPPSHQFIPVPLCPRQKKPAAACPVTGKSIGQPQHHFIPGAPKAVPHEPIPGFRYVVPVLNNPPALLQELLSRETLPDTIVAQYVYTLEEKKCGIVLPATIEAAVREGTVCDLLLQNTNERFTLKFEEGRQVTVKLVEMQPQPVAVSTQEDGTTPLLDGQGPNKKPPPPVIEKLKIPGLKPKKQQQVEPPPQTKGAPAEMAKGVTPIVGDATKAKEELAPSVQPAVTVEKPGLDSPIEQKKVAENKMQATEESSLGGMQAFIESIRQEVSKLELLETKGDVTIAAEPAKKEILEKPAQPVEKPVDVKIEEKKEDVKIEEKKEDEKKEEEEPLEKKKKQKKPPPSETDITAEHNDAKLSSQVASTRKTGVSEIADEPRRVRRGSASRALDTSVLKSVWDVAKRDEKSEKNGLSIKYVLGKQPNLKDILVLQKNMESGPVIDMVWDGELLQGKNIEISEGKFCFVPGKMVNGFFMAGQTVEGIFVPGLTVKTPAKISLIPGCVMKEEGFVAGINKELKFIPGQIFKEGEKEIFVPDEQVVTENGVKYVHRDEVPSGATPLQIKAPPKKEEAHKENGSASNGKKERALKDKKLKKVKGLLKDRNVVYGHMIQMEKGVQFYPENHELPSDGVLRTIPGQLVKCPEEEEPRFVPGMMMEGKFVAGQMVCTAEGTKFVPGQLVRNKDGAKFVPGQTLDDGQFVPGQVVDGKFVPGQIVQTTAGPTFIPGQVISTPEEGARFVPGRVVETLEGPHFVPGRVIEDQNGSVAFVPGRVVETLEGPRFVAPDLESTPDGTPKYAMQSFEVSTEELQLIEQRGTTNMESGGIIDQQMLEQLAKAGITLSQKSLPDVFVTPRNLQEIATRISGRLRLPEEAKIKISLVLEKVAELGHNIQHGKAKDDKTERSLAKCESIAQNHAFEIIESAVTAAVLTASKDYSVNPGEATVQEMNTVLDDALPPTGISNAMYTDYLVSALYEVVTSEATLEAISTSVQQGLKKPVANKVEVLRVIANKTENVHDTVEKISTVLRKQKHHPDIGKAFRRLSIGDPDIVDLVVSKVTANVSNVSTEKEATKTLQTAIVSAVRETSEKKINEILDAQDSSTLKHLILQAVSLAEALGLEDAADELLYLLQDERIANLLSKDRTALEILQRLTLMKKLAESRPAYAHAMTGLGGTVPKEDTKFLKQLVRESEALLTSVQEEDDSYEDDDDTYSTCSFNSAFDDEIISRVPRRITSSKDIPYSLFHAFVDCQKPMKLLSRILLAAQPERRFSYDHSCVILKDRNQTVIPKESSRDVLTGRASYTLIDENGVKNYEAMDVFSALNIDKPIALQKFSIYTEGLASTWVHAAELPPEINDLLSDSYTPIYDSNTIPSHDSTLEEASSCESVDWYVAICDYEAEDENGLSLKAGDIVEILDYNDYDPQSKKPRLEEGLESSGLLDTSAARHKMAIRPKRNHSKQKGETTTTSSSSTSEIRWLAKRRIVGGVGFVPHSILKRGDGEPEGECDDPMAMRNAIIRELIETEQELGRDLNYVVEKYIKPVDLGTNVPQIVKDNRDVIFSNYKKIAEFHNTCFLEGIKYYEHEPKMIGKAICRLERDFDLHVDYCRDEPAAEEFIEENEEAKEYFAELGSQLGDDKTIDEHLKLPIQRIHDYQLLLKELIKYTALVKEGTKDLERALDFMYGIPTKANDLKFINSIEGYKGSIHKLGRLLAHEWFTVTDAKKCSKERYLFLFKSRILVCKVKRISDERSIFILKDIIKLPDCEVVDVEDDPLTFQLVHKNQFTHPRYPLTLKAHGPQAKPEWIDCIKSFKEDTVALNEHFVDDLKIDGLADGETAEEESSTQKLYKKILAEEEKAKKKREAQAAFDEATRPKPRAKSKTPQPPEVAKPAEGEAAPAEAVPTEPGAESAVPGQPPVDTTAGALAEPQLPTEFRVPTPDEAANMSETQTVTYAPPPSVVPVAGVGAGGDEKPDLSLNVNLSINESQQSTPSSAPQTPIREPNRPRFTKTIDPFSCEPGETTVFECTIMPSQAPVAVTWLKDNKPLDDKLADRVTITAEENNTRFRLVMLHCRDSDTGTYTAKASNTECSAHCSAFLLVQEMSPEEKAKRAEEKGAQIMVRFKDTEVLEETYLRFLVKVKGDPLPEIHFFKDEQLITPANMRVKVVDDKAASGFYELVVPFVGAGDAGKYTCKVMNKFGEDKCEAVVKVVPEKDVFQGLGTGPPGDNVDFKWLRDGQPFNPEERFKVHFRDDEDSLALIFQHVKPEDAGLYTCVASTSSGRISCSAELTVEGSIKQLQKDPEKPLITTENKIAHANLGSSAMLELKVSGYPKPELTWTHEGQTVPHGGRFRFLHEDDETLALVIKHVEAADSGMYKLVAKNELGQSEIDIELSVKAPPKFKCKMEDRKAVSDETLVMEVDIEACPVPEVKWFRDGKELFASERISFSKDGSKHTMTILKATMEDSGTYSVVATNEVSQATEYWNLSVSQPPKFIKGLIKNMECKEQENVSLDVKIQCKPPPQVKWYICKPSQSSLVKEYKVEENKEELKVDGKHVVLTQDGDNYSLKIVGMVRSDSGFYRCVATNDYGQSTQDCEINVRCAPQMTQKLADSSITEGSTNVVLSVTANAHPEPKVTWYINDTEITESRTAFVQSASFGVWKLTLKEVSTDMTGKYTCKITNELGATECSANYTVLNKPKFIKTLSEKTEVDEGQTLNLSVTVQGTPAPTIRWYKDGKEVSADARIKITKEGSETYNLSVTVLKLEDTGDYEVKATSDQGSSSSVTKVNVSKMSQDDSNANEETHAESQKQEICEVVASKPSKAQRSMSEVTPKQAKMNEALRKHSLENVAGVAGEAQHEQETQVPASQKATRETDEAEGDGEEIDGLLQRVQKQRSVLEEILEQEDARDKEAFPTILSHTMNDARVYESLNHSFEVHADGIPRPEAKWTKDGKSIKADDRIKITSEGKLYKLDISELVMEDAGVYKCVISNRLGEKSQETKFETISVNEFRKPDLKTELKPLVINKKENGTLTLMLVADPVPEITWFHNGNEISPDNLDYEFTVETKDIENDLKECYYTITVVNALHEHTGEYTILAKNKYGEMSNSARLDVYLVPEITPLKDLTINPYENTQFEVVINSNPKPKVTWYRNDEVVSNSDHQQLISDIEAEIYRLVVTNITLVDEGLYRVVASNSLGESSQQCVLKVHNEGPQFVMPIAVQTVAAYQDVDFRVRYTGVPTPAIKWYFEGKEIKSEGRYTIEVDDEHLVSSLKIEKLEESDVGVYSVTASNLAAQAECSAQLTMAQTPPSFINYMDKYHEIDEGDTLSIKMKVDGSPIPTVKWYKDMEEITGEGRIKLNALPDGTIELTINKVKPSDCGAYKIVASNKHGEKAVLTAVAVTPFARKPVFVQPLADVIGKADSLVKLEAQVTAFPSPEVHWFKDGFPLRPHHNINFVNSPGGIIGLHFDKATLHDAGKYSVTIKNRLGELAATAVVEIEPAARKPHFQDALQPTRVVEGYPAKLDVKIYGHPKPVLTWTHRGEDIVVDGKRYKEVTSADGITSLIIDKAMPEDGGEYACTANNDLGFETCKSRLEVTPKEKDNQPEEVPVFIHPLRDANCEEGGHLTLDVPFLGNPIPEVVWSKNGQTLLPGDRVTITCDGKRVGLDVRPTTLSDIGKYECTLTNRLGKASTACNVAVRKVYQPPKFTQTFGDLQQLPNYDAKFLARVTGLPTPDVVWTRNGQVLPGRDTDKYQVKKDGDATLLYIRNCTPDDAGKYTCTAKNSAGENSCTAGLEIVEKIGKRHKAEAPVFLKKLGDCVVYQGMTARFTACVTGYPEPELEWYRDTTRLFNSERVKFEKETSGLVRLIIEKVGEADVAVYRLRATNEHGQADCEANLVYDALEERPDKKTMSDQYSEYDNIRKSGAPLPLADRPIVSRMTDRNLTLSWKPSIPKGPREPVTYRVEMCELPGGDWFNIRSGIKSCACDVRNLEPYRDYKFRVRVENKYGISDPSPYAITYREKLEPDPPKFIPYLEPNLDFRPETSPFFPKDFDIEKPHIDGFAKPPKFLRQEDYNNQYGVKGHNCQLQWFVYGYPKPKINFTFNDEPIEIGGGRFDCSYTRNGQACLFINKMLERDCGIYEACAVNEHGEARQRVNLAVAEYPKFLKRPEETLILARKSARIEVRVSGTPFPEVKWYKDWLPIAESSRIKIFFTEPDTAVLQIGEAMAKDEGLYSVSARNIAGCVSTSFSIHVEESEAAYFYSTYTGRIIKEMKPHKNKYIEEFYDIGEELGRGTQGVTYHAVERLSGRNYAAKVMHGKQDLKPFMLNELEIYNQLNHRKLLRLHDVFETKKSLTLVTELASGGELLESLTKQEYVTESEIAGYIRQILVGLEYMHSQNLAHLGLTPGDLLISHPGGDDLKISDFGLSRKIYFSKLAALNYGMPEFVAPEVANGDGVHMAVDMWSVGVITHLLLTGVSLFRGKHDRDTLIKVREGKWDDLHLISRNVSDDCRDFIKSLLMFQADTRMDVHTALKHPWLARADKIPQDEPQLSTDALRHYYQGLRDWYSNSSCRTWYRRRPLDGADTHPSCMVYPPGLTYTPPTSPRASPDRALWENKIEPRQGVDYELGLVQSESHYQYGPDTYLLQLRDVDFPCRLREYMKVAASRSQAFALNGGRDWRAPVIRERRRFTDVMDEEIDDERKYRIEKYGSADTYTLRRLRHELGSRMEGQFEAEAMVESKRDGQPPFMREKPQLLPILEDKPAKLSCLAVGDPKPVVQWFKNDNLVSEGKRVTVTEDSHGRSILSFDPAMPSDAGIYKVVARNRVGQTVARVRVVLAGPPCAPDSPEVAEKSDTEIYLKWKQPKDDGNSTVLCYSLQYKEADKVEWVDCAFNNIDHEFYLVRNLAPKTEYQFRLAARNRIGWSDKGVPSAIFKTRDVGAPKVTSISKAMLHLQQLTESGQKVQGLDESEDEVSTTILDYSVEKSPLTWKDENPAEKFNFISEISQGRFSMVAKAIERATDRVIVAKVLAWTPETELEVLREFEAWHSLRHERICILTEAYRVGTAATLILEKLQGSDVLTYLASRHEYSEQMIVYIVQQILDGLQYLHWRGICHLAIEPDNVVMSGVRSAQVKLVDFGAAQRVSKLGTCVPRSFATEFSGPELLNSEPAYPQSDVWSVGTLTYLLLSGVSPFRAATVEETKANITYVRYRFEHLYKELTSEATRFLMFIFKRTPCKRPTAEECMEHRWLLPTDHLVKKRERAVFLGNRLKEFSEQYHGEKVRAAAAMEEKRPKAIPVEVKLARSISVQEELLTPN